MFLECTNKNVELSCTHQAEEAVICMLSEGSKEWELG